jgi:hypothetical protein
MLQKQKQPNEGGRRDDGTDGRAKQKTERGCAGSRLPNTTSIEFDPVLPRSVLCTLRFQFYIMRAAAG